MQEVFWDNDSDYFGCLMPDGVAEADVEARRGEFFMFWNLQVRSE